MNAPSAAAWSPPPKERASRPPSFDAWRVGDWLNREHDARGYVPPARMDLALRVLRRVGAYVSREHLYLVALVARAVDPGRRRPALSWSHHREVAHLTPEQQDAALELAEREELSTTQLHKELRAYERLDEAA